MNKKEIAEKIGEVLTKTIIKEEIYLMLSENIYGNGSFLQRERLDQCCQIACEAGLEGDILEIGAFHGETTIKFLQTARKFKKKVVVIDPWCGTQQGNSDSERYFRARTCDFIDILDIYKIASQSVEGLDILHNRTFCFCFIDGLHELEACKSDLINLLHQKAILAIDDLLWATHLKNLFFTTANEKRISYVYHPLCREGYYINV